MSGAARELLGPRGPLSRTLEGYEDRGGQLDMAQAVERALAERRVLLCEAGTGTGKTLAYLVPAIQSGMKIVVSTATKALEEQIVHKDVPLVLDKIGLSAEVVLAKGLSNYLCRRRFEELRVGAASHEDPAVRRGLPMLEAWAAETETGDVAELSALREDDPLWREVNSSSETRIGASCDYYERCFVTRLRREAEQARIVVVNHHLFFADLAVKLSAEARGGAAARGVGALPPYDAVIFDEAHALEDVATSFFGVRLSRARVETMLRDAERAFMAHGLSDRLLSKGEGSALAAMVGEASDALFAAVPVALTPGSRPEDGRVALPGDLWQGALDSARARLDEALVALSGYAGAHAVSEAVRLVTQRADACREALARVSDPATHHVAWAEISAKGRGPTACRSIGASPVDLSALFREHVFERVGAVVLTSATLTTGGGFRYLRSRVGLGVDEEGQPIATTPVDELRVDSPFDYPSAALLYLPRDLPEVNDPSFFERAIERAAELVELSGGGAFVLTTSVRAMRAFGPGLARRLGRAVLVQGDAPKAALLGRFRAAKDGLLVATMSFWEGVDVPGDALRLVVLDKIPFAVPSDPVVAARSAALEARGKNPFVHYAVPEAAITLKQGFGRLIRTRTDRGVVAVLDRRIATRSYGGALLAALPPARRTHRLEEVAAFFADRSARASTDQRK